MAELLLSKRDERVILERSAPTLYPSVTGPYIHFGRVQRAKGRGIVLFRIDGTQTRGGRPFTVARNPTLHDSTNQNLGKTTKRKQD